MKSTKRSNLTAKRRHKAKANDTKTSVTDFQVEKPEAIITPSVIPTAKTNSEATASASAATLNVAAVLVNPTGTNTSHLVTTAVPLQWVAAPTQRIAVQELTAGGIGAAANPNSAATAIVDVKTSIEVATNAVLANQSNSRVGAQSGYKKAAEDYLQNSTDKKYSTDVLFHMALYYHRGKAEFDIPIDLKKAQFFYREGMKEHKNKNSAQYKSAYNLLAECLLSLAEKKEDIEEAITILNDEASNNNQIAKYCLGMTYGKGIANYLQPDAARMIELLGSATQAGHVPSAIELAYIYAEGRYKVKVDVERAHQAFLSAQKIIEAAGKKDGYIIYNLALNYYVGRGTAPNILLAMAMLTEACHLGCSAAQAMAYAIYPNVENSVQVTLAVGSQNSTVVVNCNTLFTMANNGNKEAVLLLGHHYLALDLPNAIPYIKNGFGFNTCELSTSLLDRIIAELQNSRQTIFSYTEQQKNIKLELERLQHEYVIAQKKWQEQYKVLQDELNAAQKNSEQLEVVSQVEKQKSAANAKEKEILLAAKQESESLIAKLREKMGALTAENKRLKEAKEEVEKLLEAKKKVELELSKQKIKNKTLWASKEEILEKMKALETQYQKLKHDLSEKDKRLIELKQTQRKNKKDNDKDKAEAKVQHEKLLAELEVVKKKGADNTDALMLATRAAQQGKDELDSVKKALLNALLSAKGESNNVRLAKEREEEAQKRERTARQETERARKETEIVTGHKQKLQKDVSERDAELDVARKSITQQQEEKTAADAVLSLSVTREQKAIAELSAARSELDAARREIALMKGREAAALEANASVNQQLLVARAKIEALKKTHNISLNNEQSLQQALAKAKKEFADLSSTTYNQNAGLSTAGATGPTPGQPIIYSYPAPSMHSVSTAQQTITTLSAPMIQAPPLQTSSIYTMQPGTTLQLAAAPIQYLYTVSHGQQSQVAFNNQLPQQYAQTQPLSVTGSYSTFYQAEAPNTSSYTVIPLPYAVTPPPAYGQDNFFVPQTSQFQAKH